MNVVPYLIVYAGKGKQLTYWLESSHYLNDIALGQLEVEIKELIAKAEFEHGTGSTKPTSLAQKEFDGSMASLTVSDSCHGPRGSLQAERCRGVHDRDGILRGKPDVVRRICSAGDKPKVPDFRRRRRSSLEELPPLVAYKKKEEPEMEVESNSSSIKLIELEVSPVLAKMASCPGAAEQDYFYFL